MAMTMTKRKCSTFLALLSMLALILWTFQSYLYKSEMNGLKCIEPYKLIVDKYGINAKSLPKLIDLSWPITNYLSFPAGELNVDGKHMNMPPPFEPLMSKGQHEVLLDLLTVFEVLMNENGLADKYFLYGGSLLGSLRHHDLIPYDDDIDVVVDDEVKAKLIQLFTDLPSPYFVYVQSSRLKFYKKDSQLDDGDWLGSHKTSEYSWLWPYLDISFYRCNQTHVYELGKSYGRYYAWKKEIVFPLKYRPFGTKWLPAPRMIHTFVRDMYSNTKECTIMGYSHIFEGPNELTSSIPCSKLFFKYAFVEFHVQMHPRRNHPVIIEKLQKFQQIQDHQISKIFHTLCFPYEEIRTI